MCVFVCVCVFPLVSKVQSLVLAGVNAWDAVCGYGVVGPCGGSVRFTYAHAKATRFRV